MAKSNRSKHDEQHLLTRRALIKWSLAAGAAVGLGRAKIAEVLEAAGGRELAYAATELPACRTIHIAAGQGGLAWFQLLWPHNAVAAAHNDRFAYHRPGQSSLIAGTDRPLTRGPDTPWQDLPPQRQVTAFTCGENGTHRDNPLNGVMLNNISLYAIAAHLQSANAATVPAVALRGYQGADLALQYRGMLDYPAPITAENASGFVDIFNSAASRAGGIVANAKDAELYESHYKTLVGLQRAANRTNRTPIQSAKQAAHLLGANLAAQLSVTPQDRQRYGISAASEAKIVQLAESFIVVVKAFRMGLTSSLVLPAMLDDPHEAFANGTATSIPPQLKTVFDGLRNDLRTTDEGTDRALDLDTVITIHGDTPKDPFNRDAWPDGTPNGSNWAYVYSAGHLKSGWFGDATADGQINGFDGNGNAAPYDADTTANYAHAAIAYAIAKRDAQRIAPLAPNLTIAGVFGRLKDA